MMPLPQVVWRWEVTCDEESASVVFSHTSPDGTEGYPGQLEVRVFPLHTVMLRALPLTIV